MKILLVDDSKVQRWTIQKNLQRAGFTVSAAADGEEGLRLALQESPDLIVLDMLLPKMGGLEVLRLLKRVLAAHHPNSAKAAGHGLQ